MFHYSYSIEYYANIYIYLNITIAYFMSLDLANISRYSKTKFKNIIYRSVIYKYIKTIQIGRDKKMINLKTFPIDILIETMSPAKRKKYFDTVQKEHLTKLLKNAY